MELRFVALIGVFCALGCSPLAAFAADPTPAAAPSSPQKPAIAHFDILAFQVLGSTKLSVADIERAVYPFAGPRRTEADVESARAALQSLYDKRGFPTVSVTVPAQNAKSGLITLQIEEQRIGQLRVVGANYFSPDDIQRAAPSLAEGGVPNFKEVQRDIVALNQLPDRRVTPEIKAGVAPGTVDVDLKVEDQLPLHGTLELNNRSSANTSDLRLTGTIHYDNLWQLGHSFTLTAQTAPERPSDARVFSASYLARFGDSPFSLLGYAVRSDSEVAAISDFNVIGNGTLLGLRLVRTLPAREGFFHSLSVGIDDKDFKEDTLFGADRSSAPIHYFPLSAAYNANWMHGDSSTELGVTATANLRGIGDGDAQFDAKRYLAKPNFFYLRVDASHTLTFGGGYQLFGHVQTQFANEPLISNEEFSIGGLDTVRGFFESAALGDYGAAGQLELRSRPLWGEANGPNNARVLAFVDAGYARILDPLPEQIASDTLVSTGIGATVHALGHLNGSLDLAVPLSVPPAAATRQARRAQRAVPVVGRVLAVFYPSFPGNIRVQNALDLRNPVPVGLRAGDGGIHVVGCQMALPRQDRPQYHLDRSSDPAAGGQDSGACAPAFRQLQFRQRQGRWKRRSLRRQRRQDAAEIPLREVRRPGRPGRARLGRPACGRRQHDDAHLRLLRKSRRRSWCRRQGQLRRRYRRGLPFRQPGDCRTGQYGLRQQRHTAAGAGRERDHRRRPAPGWARAGRGARLGIAQLPGGASTHSECVDQACVRERQRRRAFVAGCLHPAAR